MKEILTNAFEAVTDNKLYSSKGFDGARDARKVLEYSMYDLAIADRQAVVDSMAEGTSREDSLKEYLSDENFEKWYADIYAKLCEYEG